jgi:hypothetical protein
MLTTNFYKDFIGVYDNALTQSECDYIIKAFNEIEDKEKHKITDSIHVYGTELVRKDFSIFTSLHLPNVQSLVGNKLHECLMLYCEEYFVLKNIRSISKEVKLQRTPPRGGYHVWHCEQDATEYSSRVLVWTIYLNDVPYNEGETEFLWQGIRVNPKAGRCVLWPAAFTHHHRGNPVYTHDKYIATGWYTLI